MRLFCFQKLVLSDDPSSQSYSSWNSDVVPVYFKVYLFNVTNPENVVWKKEKPVLEEVGPYVYR